MKQKWKIKLTSLIFTFVFISSGFILLGINCGGGGGSDASTCVVSTSCLSQCSGTGYSNDGGTNCYSDSACQTTCSHAQTDRLRITNNCNYDIWIQQQNMPASTPDVVKITSGGHYDYDLPDVGQASTRLWPKTGCDSNGENCTVGQSSNPCPTGGCPPPVDSKIEATWGCTLESSKCTITPQGQPIGDTYYNSSAVDGYTLPFKITVVDGTLNSDCVNIDCSNLSLDQCPTNENLSQGKTQTYPQYANEDLRVMNSSGTQIGCYSPCKKLDYPTYGGVGIQNEQSDAEIMYCCPTPGVTSAECRAGPVANTTYVSRIHNMCPGGGYGYAYDDNVGNHHCAPSTKFEMTFCP